MSITPEERDRFRRIAERHGLQHRLSFGTGLCTACEPEVAWKNCPTPFDREDGVEGDDVIRLLDALKEAEKVLERMQVVLDASKAFVAIAFGPHHADPVEIMRLRRMANAANDAADLASPPPSG